MFHEEMVHDAGCRLDTPPQTGNREADGLANGNVEDFSPELEIKVDAGCVRWEVLPEVPRMAREAETEYQELKQQGRLPKRDRRQKKRKPEEKMRLKDPWCTCSARGLKEGIRT